MIITKGRPKRINPTLFFVPSAKMRAKPFASLAYAMSQTVEEGRLVCIVLGRTVWVLQLFLVICFLAAFVWYVQSSGHRKATQSNTLYTTPMVSVAGMAAPGLEGFEARPRKGTTIKHLLPICLHGAWHLLLEHGQ